MGPHSRMRQATASRDPVGEEQSSSLPRPPSAVLTRPPSALHGGQCALGADFSTTFDCRGIPLGVFFWETR
jgi:hypothetical protein